MEKTMEEKLNEIVELLKERDYIPVAQLTGYIENDNPDYITRHGGAREKIKEIDKETIINYIANNK